MRELIYRLQERVRLDKFLAGALPDLSRSNLQKMIKEAKCTVNAKPVKANYICTYGDRIYLDDICQPVDKAEIRPEAIGLDIIFEDEDFLVINKPRGMVVHPAPGHTSGTLVNAVMNYCGKDLSTVNGSLRPGIVHRIDKDTTGLLLVVKNDEMHRQIALALKDHSLYRRYEALVQNNIKADGGTIRTFLGRANGDRKKFAVTDKGRLAITHYQVLERLKQGQYTYVSCRLETGRTHQIRVHMASQGNPILGDRVYGPKKTAFHLEGQLLHARDLGFLHPRTKQEMFFTCELPADFKNILTVLRNYDNLS